MFCRSARTTRKDRPAGHYQSPRGRETGAANNADADVAARGNLAHSAGGARQTNGGARQADKYAPDRGGDRHLDIAAPHHTRTTNCHFDSAKPYHASVADSHFNPYPHITANRHAMAAGPDQSPGRSDGD